jgi:hypothetical protein
MIRTVRRRPGYHTRRASGAIHCAMRVNAKWTAGHLHPHLHCLVQMHHVQRTSFAMTTHHCHIAPSLNVSRS